jgi:hypothetical protein
MIKNFLFLMSSRLALGFTKPPIQWVPGTLSLGLMRPEREADHSPPNTSEVKKTWIYTSTPPYVFMEGRLTFTFLPQGCNPSFIMSVKEGNELRKSENEVLRKIQTRENGANVTKISFTTSLLSSSTVTLIK